MLCALGSLACHGHAKNMPHLVVWSQRMKNMEQRQPLLKAKPGGARHHLKPSRLAHINESIITVELLEFCGGL